MSSSSTRDQKKKRGRDDTDEDARKPFVSFIVHCHKDEANYHYMLQWDGNEEALTLLHELVEIGGEDQGGEISWYEMSLEKHLISPSTIKEVNALQTDLKFLTGTMNSPFSKDDLEEEKHKIADLLYDHVRGMGIEYLFRPKKNNKN